MAFLNSEKFKVFACAIALATSLLPVERAMASPAPPKEQVWALRQKHHFVKTVNLFITKDAIKIDGVTHDWGILCKAPAWDAFCYNRLTKKFWKSPYSTWTKQGFALTDYGEDLSLGPLNTQSRTGDYGGVKVLIRRWMDAPPQIAFFSETHVGPKQCLYVLASSTNLPTTLQIRQLVHQFYKIPMTDGLPLMMTVGAQGQPMLRTDGFKKEELSAHTFELPRDYKPCKVEADIWFNATDRTNIDNFSQLFLPSDSK